MPVYEYICKKCNQRMEGFRSITERNNPPKHCGVESTKLISVFSTGDSSGYPYEDPILGRTIDSPGDRRKEMKKQGLIERG